MEEKHVRSIKKCELTFSSVSAILSCMFWPALTCNFICQTKTTIEKQKEPFTGFCSIHSMWLLVVKFYKISLDQIKKLSLWRVLIMKWQMCVCIYLWQFTRECMTANSTHRLDFKPNLSHRPDVVVRRKAFRRSEVWDKSTTTDQRAKHVQFWCQTQTWQKAI